MKKQLSCTERERDTHTVFSDSAGCKMSKYGKKRTSVKMNFLSQNTKYSYLTL